MWNRPGRRRSEHRLEVTGFRGPKAGPAPYRVSVTYRAQGDDSRLAKGAVNLSRRGGGRRLNYAIALRNQRPRTASAA